VPEANVQDLIPHPQNTEIYGDGADPELVESIREKGVLNPVLVTADHRIISGHRRWAAVKKAHGPKASIPITYFGSNDELDVLEALIHSNRQRDKTNEMKAREYGWLKKIKNEQNNRQGQRSDKLSSDRINGIPEKGTSDNALSEVPPTRQAAAEVGISQPAADKAEAVVEVIDTLEAKGDARSAKQLRTTLNGKGGISKAHKAAKEKGFIAPAPKVEPPAPTFTLLSDWLQWDAQSQSQVLVPDRASKAKFTFQEDDNIEWAKWSFNPVTGCRHDCSYCYARDIAERFYAQGFKPTVYRDRLAAPCNTKVPTEASTDVTYKNVFTCSMADLFGRWVPSQWIQAVLDVAEANPQWNFLFLTKFPIRLQEFEFPDNAWVGATVDAQARIPSVEASFEQVTAKVKWLSCEPMLERLTFSRLDLFDWLVIGGASNSTQTPEFRPPREWLNHLEDQAAAANCQVYEKTNLLARLRNYPGQTTVPSVNIPSEFKMGYLQRDLTAPDKYAAEA
jgi:protein gp37